MWKGSIIYALTVSRKKENIHQGHTAYCNRHVHGLLQSTVRVCMGHLLLPPRRLGRKASHQSPKSSRASPAWTRYKTRLCYEIPALSRAESAAQIRVRGQIALFGLDWVLKDSLRLDNWAKACCACILHLVISLIFMVKETRPGHFSPSFIRGQHQRRTYKY